MSRLPALAGVDGCPGGWVAAFRDREGRLSARVFPGFRALLDALTPDATVAVDMPIGLPERSGHGGRGPETLVRPLLGQRQSSVFSIPSRAAVHAEPGPFAGADEWYAAHARASAVARATSDPPRGVSIQAFGIFSRIRELDTLLIAESALCRRVIESHPEVAFWRMNAGRALDHPKKVKGRVNPAGMAERGALLAAQGIDAASPPLPRGAAQDDVLDACAMLWVAGRHARGETISFPDPPGADGFGLPVAIRC